MLMISLIDKDKKEYHAHAHSLLRECLRHRGIIYDDSLVFSSGEHGKPALSGYTDVHFNLSHAAGIAACIVSSRECGIDCEMVREYRPNVIRRAFSEEEKRLMEETPESERSLMFFRLWTLKEAYVKAIGIGISYPLDTASFSFSEDGGIVTDISSCTFRQYIIKEKYVVSVCRLDA